MSAVLWSAPVAAAAGAALLLRYWSVRRAAARGLVNRRGERSFTAALALGGLFLIVTLASATYETSFLFPVVGALAIVATVAAAAHAVPGMHPALRGLSVLLPGDGIDWVERSRPATGWRAQFRVWFWRLAPLLPAWAILIWVAAPQQRRWPVWLALAVALAAPALVVAQRRAWFGPLALLIVPLVFFWRARGLQSTLPAGHWTTLWTNARCTDRVVPAGDGSAWCVNIQSERVYHFRLQSGRVMGEYDVPDSWDILEAAPVGAWVRQDPIDNLVFASGNTAQALGLYRPVYAAAREPGELWYVDWNQRLRLHTADEPAGATLTHQDGLLRSRVLSVEVTPDGSVWVGAQAGLNHLPAGSSTWERFGSEVGLRGSILRIIPAPDGAIWLLQPRGFGANGDHWGVSARTPAGAWLHLDLEALTGFEMPRGHDGLAVDGLGRLWLFLVSNTREKYLAVLDPDDLLNFSLTSMGKLSASGSYRANAHGVVSDGAGGIFLYNGELEPLRHWTP